MVDLTMISELEYFRKCVATTHKSMNKHQVVSVYGEFVLLGAHLGNGTGSRTMVAKLWQ